ncbi:unnamed protein product [Hermetia illucens]|uniref:Uncharacterized protein n=2 Tax=Hermetia illucens TaxID=343691 RepID=A0A7R8UX71_HERIL|nr:unnamed protein product [Hermetia illucens]
MKFLYCLPAFLVGILLLLQFGSCGPTARPCCEEDDHRNSKIMGLLGVLAGDYLTGKINLQTAQYNFFGSKFPKISIGLGQKIYNTANDESDKKGKDDLIKPSETHIIAENNLTITYGREQPNSKQPEHTDSMTKPNDSITDQQILERRRPKRQTTDADDIDSENTVTEDPVATETDIATETPSTSTTSLPPTDSYGPPPSGVPSSGYYPASSSAHTIHPWNIAYPPSHTTPHPSYGLPSISTSTSYLPQNLDSFASSQSDRSFGYPHIYPSSFYYPSHPYYPSNPFFPHYPYHSYFRPSYPDHTRNLWDWGTKYFTPIYVGKWKDNQLWNKGSLSTNFFK